MAKLERRMHAMFAKYENTSWQILGVSNDDLSKELNPDVEVFKNVIGETEFRHSGYEPEISNDPYYADSESPLYENLKKSALEEDRSDDTILGKYAEVVFQYSNDGKLAGIGFMRDAYIVPESIGGDTAGVKIPFSVHPTGPMSEIMVVYQVATHEMIEYGLGSFNAYVSISGIEDPQMSVSENGSHRTYSGTTTESSGTITVRHDDFSDVADIDIMIFKTDSFGDTTALSSGDTITWDTGDNRITIFLALYLPGDDTTIADTKLFIDYEITVTKS